MSMVRLLSQRCTNSVVPNSCIVWHPIQRRIVSSGYTTIGCSCEDHALSHLSWWVSRNCWIIFNYYPTAAGVIVKKGIKKVYYIEPIGQGCVAAELVRAGVDVQRLVVK